jgi:succinate dehydrogenase / fumarate reductase flavoprotein subunit
MMESIRKLESTRAERMKQEIPLQSQADRQKLLEEFHPDYNKASMRALKVGPSKGDRTPHEFADLFEAYSLLDPDKHSLSRIDYETDVLIIGGGGAGAAAALAAQEAGANVLMVTKLRLGDANTMMAQGGIQGADKANDSPAQHYLDVIGGGRYFNIPELVKALVIDGPEVLSWLEDMGMMFDKQPDGTMVTIHGGGTSRKRMHSARDYTGAEIMKTLRDEVNNKKIDVIEFSPAVELLVDNGKCTGAVLYNLETMEYLNVRAKTTIVATGGSGRLHVQGFPTTNHYGATGDGLVIAYRAGCKLLYLDTIQYHPTGAAFPEQILGQLVTEKVRGLGAQITNVEGNRFVYELETRDVEAAAIIRECTAKNKGVLTPSGMKGVWLDSPLIEVLKGEGAVKQNLPAMFRQFERFGIDMSKEPILIYPTQHYQNGGIEIDAECETELENLYVSGEPTGGVHGRNRLMGNSLLDVLVFGRIAGKSAAEKSQSAKPGRLTLDHVKKYHEELRAAGIDETRKSPMLLPDYRSEEVKKKGAVA